MPIIKKWDWEIGNDAPIWNWNIKETWDYRHLLFSMIKRDFVLNYQQTILGPLWSLIQPILTLVIYIIVFRNLVGLPVGTIPPALFYFSGIVLWNFFSESFNGTTNTFKDHFYLFSKVYFPRIIMPISVVCTHFLRCLIQMTMLLLLILYYWLNHDFQIIIDFNLLGAPLSIFMIGLLSLGVGLIVSLITAKYRDIANMVSLSTRLLMFLTPVIYPLASVRPNLKWIVEFNPLTAYFELFRFSLFREGQVSYSHLLVSIMVTISLLLIALVIFNRKSNYLLDTV